MTDRATSCSSTFMQQVEHLSIGGALFLSVVIVAIAAIAVTFVRGFFND